HEETLWKQTFDEHQVTSPAPKRSEDEWRLFLQCLKNDPDFSKALTCTESVVYHEMPFFWPMDENRCLEGIVDLALFQSVEKKWFVLDWETNRIEPDEIDKMRASYRSQIAAYWKAVAEITNQPVSAAIYATATRQYIVHNYVN